MSSSLDRAQVTLENVRGLFARQAVWQSWLDVEAALAQVQASIGIIPEAAAVEIVHKANFEAIDAAALAADIGRTRAPVVSLVRALSSACNGDAGGYVHWGATTQNVMQTGLVLQMRKAHAAFMARCDALLNILIDLAEASAETVTVARTNQRHALPVTFGFKVAAWIEELLRHRERFGELDKRVFRVQWGGTVGAMHILDSAGPEINQRLAAHLGLGFFAVPSRAALDGFAEYALCLGLFSATCGKIARNLYLLMADEIEELSESLDAHVVGSSTMPHKINPKYSVKVLALAAQMRGQVPLALDAMQPTHEGDAASNMLLTQVIETLCPMAFDLADQMVDLFEHLVLHPKAMQQNLELKGGMLASENVMMALAPLLGRVRAHDLVHSAVLQSDSTGRPLDEVILSDAEVAGRADPERIRMSARPDGYIGQSIVLTRKMAALARSVLSG
jgi:3-carboxy-cis,cis-muconate cycloisomerase